MRALTTCTDGSLLVIPEDADGVVLQVPDRTPDQPEPGGASEQPAPWALSSDAEEAAQAGGTRRIVHSALHCADSAHDFAMAELKVRRR